MSINWINITQRLQAISQAGLAYCKNEFDEERYLELKKICAEIISNYTNQDFNTITDLLDVEEGYLTPKTDIRAVVFRENKILMVKEKIDDKWSLPGGWADVGFSPFEIAEKEVYEEAGIQVRPLRLLAIFDKNKHAHPPHYHYVYKVFILCEYIKGDIKPGTETSDVAYYGLNEIPDLSEPRITYEQIKTMFGFLEDPDKNALCD